MPDKLAAPVPGGYLRPLGNSMLLPPFPFTMKGAPFSGISKNRSRGAQVKANPGIRPFDGAAITLVETALKGATVH